MRRLLALILALVAAAPALAGVDPGLVGTWRTTSTDALGETWTFTLEIRSDGTYRTTQEGPFPRTPEEGIMQAEGGRYSVRVTSGLTAGQTATGTYRLEGTTLLLTGPRGTIPWTRLAPPAPSPARQQPVPGGPVAEVGKVRKGEGGRLYVPVSAVNWTSVSPGALAPAARQAARAWKSDARLVQILAVSGPDGRINVAANPGHLFYNFLSPSTGYGLSITPSAKGHFVLYPSPGPLGITAQELPSGFLDLGEAIARARGAGLHLPAYGACLQVFPPVGGRPARFVWMLAALGGVTPQALGVEAASGQVMSAEEAAGTAEMARVLAEKMKGRSFPAGHPSTLEWYRGQAEALAREIHPGYLLYRVDLRGPEVSGSLVLETVRFHFLVVAGWCSYHVVTLEANSQGIRGTGTRWLNEARTPAFPIPLGRLSEQEVFRKLQASGPVGVYVPSGSGGGVQHDTVYTVWPRFPPGLTYHLQLVSVGFDDGLQAPVTLDPAQGEAQLEVDVTLDEEGARKREQLQGRWAWSLIGEGQIAWSRGGASADAAGQRSGSGIDWGHTVPIYLDPDTGRRL